MKPEDIKVGTIFKNNFNEMFVVVDISNNGYVDTINLEGNSKIKSFSKDGEFAKKCNVIFIPSSKSQSDLILPTYYATDTPYEPFKIADFYNMNIREFSALKYLLRSKDESKRVEDLKKAITCIHKEIIRLESLKESGN